MRVRWTVGIAALLGLVLVVGCGLFSSPYDTIRHENFTRLKAQHMKFLDDWTEGSGRAWDRVLVDAACDDGDLTFREAHEYAKSKGGKDSSGERAVSILWEQFRADCALIVKRGKLFSPVFMEELRPQIIQNYDHAIQGETDRVAPVQ